MNNNQSLQSTIMLWYYNFAYLYILKLFITTDTSSRLYEIIIIIGFFFMYKGCNCNNHATSCHHDAAVFELTGRTSGGVCDGCTDNTMGRNCEQCKQYFYQDPTKPFTDRDVCLRMFFMNYLYYCYYKLNFPY